MRRLNSAALTKKVVSSSGWVGGSRHCKVVNFSERLLSQRGLRYRFEHKGFRGGWQFVATNVNKESSASINHIVIRFLRFLSWWVRICDSCVAGNQTERS